MESKPGDHFFAVLVPLVNKNTNWKSIPKVLGVFPVLSVASAVAGTLGFHVWVLNFVWVYPGGRFRGIRKGLGPTLVICTQNSR